MQWSVSGCWEKLKPTHLGAAYTSTLQPAVCGWQKTSLTSCWCWHRLHAVINTLLVIRDLGTPHTQQPTCCCLSFKLSSKARGLRKEDYELLNKNKQSNERVYEALVYSYVNVTTLQMGLGWYHLPSSHENYVQICSQSTSHVWFYLWYQLNLNIK